MAKEFPAPAAEGPPPSDSPTTGVPVTREDSAGFPASPTATAPVRVADEDRPRGSAEEVAQAVEGFRAFWDRYGNLVLLVVIVAAVIWIGWGWWDYRQQQTRQEALRDLAMARTPEALEAVADEHAFGSIPAEALIRGGDRALQEAVTPADATPAAGGADENASVGPVRDREASLKLAAHLYERALEVTDQPLFQWHALAGLANVAETRAEFDAAAKLWQDAASRAGDLYPYLAGQARQRLSLLERLRQPVVTATEPSPRKDAVEPRPQPVPTDSPEPVQPPTP